MNFTTLMGMAINGHRDIDVVDVHVNADTRLYIDPERIALSKHPFALAACDAIDDFFTELCYAAAARNKLAVYRLLSFGREPNETHLGLSTTRSRGKGTTPEILMPIVNDMIAMGLFDAGLITQLGDLQLWTPNFQNDRLSDLVTNIIRSVLVDYTYRQYEVWNLPLPDIQHQSAPTWSVPNHCWITPSFPHFFTGRFHTLLVPKAFVGRSMLSSPGELLHTYALRYRQQEHLDEHSDYCHHTVKKNGDEVWKPPTKRELYELEVKGRPAKLYLREMGYEYPNMVRELHAAHRNPVSQRAISISDAELDIILYGQSEIAI